MVESTLSVSRPLANEKEGFSEIPGGVVAGHGHDETVQMVEKGILAVKRWRNAWLGGYMYLFDV